MGKVTEIRWHARGGQGAKTAAILLAEAAATAGYFIQGFPEYGPERMGAPMLAFNRISDEPIRLHCSVTEPDVVVVLDPTLIGKVDVARGTKEDSVIIVNTSKTPAEVRKMMKLQGRKVYTVNADQISIDTIGKAFPNTPMMGAIMKVTNLIPFDQFLAETKVQLEKKFRTKPEVVKGNLSAVERAYQEVQAE